MVRTLLKLIARLIRRDEDSVECLYYLYGIKPIGADRSIIDECTVTK